MKISAVLTFSVVQCMSLTQNSKMARRYQNGSLVPTLACSSASPRFTRHWCLLSSMSELVRSHLNTMSSLRISLRLSTPFHKMNIFLVNMRTFFILIVKTSYMKMATRSLINSLRRIQSICLDKFSLSQRSWARILGLEGTLGNVALPILLSSESPTCKSVSRCC